MKCLNVPYTYNWNDTLVQTEFKCNSRSPFGESLNSAPVVTRMRCTPRIVDKAVICDNDPFVTGHCCRPKSIGGSFIDMRFNITNQNVGMDG